MSILILEFEEKKDASQILKLAKERKGKGRLIKEGEWEDFMLGKLIEKSEAEGGEVPLEKVFQKLRKNGNNR